MPNWTSNRIRAEGEPADLKAQDDWEILSFPAIASTTCNEGGRFSTRPAHPVHGPLQDAEPVARDESASGLISIL